MGETIRVLHVLGNLNLGGAESRTMDLYRHMDREKVQFDFAVHGDKKGVFEDEIYKLGGQVYHLPKFKVTNWNTYCKAWKALFAEHPGYAAVHGHMTSTASIYLPIAKKAGVKLTIGHARNAGVDKGPRGWMTTFLRRNLWKKADVCLTTSALAGISVFGKKAVKLGKVRIVPNGIDTGKFSYHPEIREQMRRKLGLEDCFVIGHVGRFDYQKNHSFLLDIFAETAGECPQARLLLVGGGDGMAEAKEKAKALGIAEKVLFVGTQTKVADFYQAMDCFVFPSFFEGLPGSVLEAQTTGLPCIISDTITREVGVTKLVEFVPLSLSAKEWAVKALASRAQERKGMGEELKEKGYDVETQVAQMIDFYQTGQVNERWKKSECF